MEIKWDFNPSGSTTIDNPDIGLSIIPVSTNKTPFKIQKSDVDLILDEYVMLPETIGDMFSITNLDLVSSLSTRFPAFSKRLNVPTIGKMMVERGFETTRKSSRRLSCYVISKHSKVLKLLENDSQTWQLMVEPFIESVCKNNDETKKN